ncbi:MAG: hypothetical protein N3B13_04280, partial [Deltaproteobacteria bacterium]|nr:hypothetical protein [Deltaproteobacteria bacterium]
PSCNDYNESAPACYYKFMNIFADLDLAPQTSPAPLYTPSVSIKSVQRGKIVFSNADSDYEYSFRINNGLWSFFMSGNEISLDVSETNYEAKYRIDVRYRKKGTMIYQTVNLPIVAIADFTPPSVELSRDEGKVILDVRDAVSPRDKILVEYSFDGINFAATAGDIIYLQPKTETLYIKAVDEASNSVIQKVTIHEIKPAYNISATTSTGGAKAENITGCSCNFVE